MGNVDCAVFAIYFALSAVMFSQPLRGGLKRPLCSLSLSPDPLFVIQYTHFLGPFGLNKYAIVCL